MSSIKDTLVLTKNTDLAPESLKKYKELGPVQSKLDSQDRHIAVLVYQSQRTPAVFKCKVCEHIWEVKQARYVTQQQRGCRKCAGSLISLKAKQRGNKHDN